MNYGNQKQIVGEDTKIKTQVGVKEMRCQAGSRPGGKRKGPKKIR